MRVVVALGGNALSPTGGTGSAAEMRAALAGAAEALAELVGAGTALVLTHGNGPQVGRILLQQEAAAPAVPPMPMDVCGARVAGPDRLPARPGARQRAARPRAAAACLPARSPRWWWTAGTRRSAGRPSRSGRRTTRRPRRAIATASGHVFGEVTPGRWRRLVASPLPVDFVEAEPMRLVAGSGHVLVAAGGGGVPVVLDGGQLPRGGGGGGQGPHRGPAGAAGGGGRAGRPHRGAAGAGRLGHAGRPGRWTS